MATKNELLDAFALLEERAPTSCPLPGEPRTRRPRRRQWAAVAAVVVAVQAIATGIALFADHGGPASQQPATSAPTTTAPPHRRFRHRRRAHAPARTCARIAVQGSEMSRPFIVVELRNSATRGMHAARLSGADGLQRFRPMRISVRHGVYERVDPGPHTVTLRPGGTTAFAVGTATAYGGGAHLIMVRALTITVPGDTAPIRLPVTGMAASGPPGAAAIPVGVTAFGTSAR